MKNLISNIFKIINNWIIDFHKKLIKANGWILFFKVLAVIGALIGILYTNLNYQSARLNLLAEKAENAYYQFDDNLGSPESLTKRIGVINSVPDLLFFEAPVKIDIGPIEALFITLKFRSNSSPFNNYKIKERFVKYVKSQNSQNPLWSHEEMNSIINILLRIGETGWFGSKASINSLNNKDLTWIWDSKFVNQNENVTLSSIFEEIKLTNIDFSNISINNGRFTKSDLSNSKFFNNEMSNAIFSNSTLNNITFYNVKANNINLQNAKMRNANIEFSKFLGDYNNFRNCKMDSLNISKSILKNCYFDENADLKYSKFYSNQIGASSFRDGILENIVFFTSNLIKINFHSADLQYSTFELDSLTDIDFSNANLEKVKFINCKFSNEIDFSNSNLNGAVFIGKDLDTDLLNNDFVNWKDAKVKGVTGFTKKQIEVLSRKGAIIK